MPIAGNYGNGHFYYQALFAKFLPNSCQVCQVCQILFYPVVRPYLRHYKEMDVQCRKHEKGTGDTDTFCLCSHGWFCKHSVTSSYLPRGKC